MIEKPETRILIVDDDPFTLNLLNRMLGNLGFAPAITCDSGCNALEWIDSPSHRPDLILLDMNMPEMDGVEFLRYLAGRHYRGSLILVSGEDKRILQTTENLAHAHQIMLLGSLCKPVTPEGLAALLEKWLPPSQCHQPQTAQVDYGADELRAAIADGALVNYYQPQVEIATGRVAGVETLVRWQHPHDGVVLPGQFIGLAEAHGLIDDLTRTVLTGALEQAKLWQESGLALQVAVNISMDNLTSLGFADIVTGLTTAIGVPPQQVVLEVTESQLMRDQRTPLEVLARLRLKHFWLSIDDFGTGHSSLAQLRDIPFNELKIDQSFVHRAWCNDTTCAMFDASLGLAKQLHMKIVAEGVEDPDDWEFLRNTECDLAQGYFIAKPMPASDLPGWIQAWQARWQKEFAVS